MKRFTACAITNPVDLMFGTAPSPCKTRRGLEIGGGRVYPELNFTLPSMQINEETFSKVTAIYRSMCEDVCRRACELSSEGIVVEFETLPEMTVTPAYAIEISGVLNDVLERFYKTEGLPSALRVTPNDTREMKRPPVMRTGEYLDAMLQTFDGCARAGADLLSIESTGGKEIHDDALMNCDVSQMVFALGVLGCRDMSFLWEKICSIADKTDAVAAGDTACGFGNTAMVLAEKKFIPRIIAAVNRVLTVPRSLVAYEQGAVGPGKDCGYENIFIKAITGYPMSMEGKSAACAHFSPVGNIAAAACDLWSNESVQDVKLLSGRAPVVSMEQLVYDCRLMNRARAMEQTAALQEMLVSSDAPLDPQAFILSPVNAVRIAQTIVKASTPFAATKACGLEAVAILREGVEAGEVSVPENEAAYIDSAEMMLQGIPDDEDVFIDMMGGMVDEKKCHLEEYGIAAKAIAS